MSGLVQVVNPYRLNGASRRFIVELDTRRRVGSMLFRSLLCLSCVAASIKKSNSISDQMVAFQSTTLGSRIPEDIIYELRDILRFPESKSAPILSSNATAALFPPLLFTYVNATSSWGSPHYDDDNSRYYLPQDRYLTLYETNKTQTIHDIVTIHMAIEANPDNSCKAVGAFAEVDGQFRKLYFHNSEMIVFESIDDSVLIVSYKTQTLDELYEDQAPVVLYIPPGCRMKLTKVYRYGTLTPNQLAEIQRDPDNSYFDLLLHTISHKAET